MPQATDQLGRLYVGTIHGYCFRLLQTHVPSGTRPTRRWTPNQLTNLLYREQSRLKLKRSTPTTSSSAASRRSRRASTSSRTSCCDVDALPEGAFRETLEDYYAMLDRYRFMSFGTQIVEAVRALGGPGRPRQR